MMNSGTMRVANTTMTPRVLGVRWRNTIRAGLAPMARAAVTNSACRRPITCPRTTRHRVSQLSRATAKNRLNTLRPNSAMRMITTSRYGSPNRISTPRMMTVSSRPPA